jgi:hypothetical protein
MRKGKRIPIRSLARLIAVVDAATLHDLRTKIGIPKSTYLSTLLEILFVLDHLASDTSTHDHPRMGFGAWRFLLHGGLIDKRQRHLMRIGRIPKGWVRNRPVCMRKIGSKNGLWLKRPVTHLVLDIHQAHELGPGLGVAWVRSEKTYDVDQSFWDEIEALAGHCASIPGFERPRL